jgi:hypothetical protein
MRILLLAILLFSGASIVCGQAVWAVTSTPSVSDRYDDIYFLNSDTGWAISLYFLGNQQGQVLRTYTPLFEVFRRTTSKFK